jgi:hypothetical protein
VTLLTDPEGTRLPIKLDTTSNGEFVPVPLSPANREANRLAHAAASHNAKRLDISKRDFLISACGAASTLLSFNAANAAAGKTGGFFDLPAESALDLQLARAQVGAARTTSCGGRIPSGTDRRRTRSRRFALSRSRPSCAPSMAIRRSRRRCARRSSG